MYSKSLCIVARKGLYAALVVIAGSAYSYAQSSFDFTGPPVLVAGNDLEQGAVYRFSGVTEGTDALVEVSALNNATLIQLDDPTGVARALQPEIDGDALGSYVEFNVSFVETGTAISSPVTGTFSALDIDSVVEFDTFFDVSDYTVETNSDLSLVVSAPQTLEVTGGGLGYEPTSEANTAVVVSVGVNELAGFTYRAGVNGNATRQTSLLFDSVIFDAAEFSNINDAPSAQADVNSVVQNSTLTVGANNGLLANDSDLDIGVDTDTLMVDSISVGVNTYVPNNSVSLAEGELTVNSNGSYEFVPAVNYSGSVAVVSYQVVDGNGGSDNSTLSLSVVASGAPPVANPDSAVLSSYDPLLIEVLENDSDDSALDSASLIWVADLSGYPDGSSLSSDLKVLSIASEGVWAIAGGAVQFTPAPETSGVITSVTYSVSDDDGQRVSSQISLEDGLASSELVVIIDEDIDDNGFIGGSEISGLIDVSAQLPAEAMVGDLVSIAYAADIREVVLDANDLLANAISVVFNTPEDGALVQVRASLIDVAGNQSAISKDQAVLDISATEAPVVSISADLDNTGFISAQENSDSMVIVVVLPASAGVNDKLTITSGATATEIVLAPLDIANGSVSTVIPSPADGDALSVVAQVTDEAGNRSASGSDSAMIDITAPAEPLVYSVVSSSSMPRITGTVPVDSNYLLSVQVNGMLYASGDGQLTESGDGAWTLTIPASDALPDGRYDVSAVVTDMAGNSSIDRTAGELTVDLQAPELAANNIGPSSDNAPVLSGSSDQQDGTLVVVKTEAGARVCEAVLNNNTWRCAAQIPLLIGMNSLTATVIDTAGNSTSDIFNVTVAAATDTDGDTIPDDLETTNDFDGDGIPNYLDLDSDNDTISDAIESQIDKDSDGIRNYLDLDSDNDGLSDLSEATVRDNPTDTRGQISSSVLVGKNGLADSAESAADSGLGNLPVDTDKDGIPDFLDQDSDGDGISDVVENGAADTDGDAMRLDGLLVAAMDSDRDGIPNFRDLDSDQDGITDIRELPASDENGDGMVDNFIDADNNGVADNAAGRPVGLSGGQAQDLDSDGLANFLDLDSDGDSKFDLIEAGGADINNDGEHDAFIDENSNAVPDTVDAQLTLGDDADGDFIDDLYDADFVAGTDTDQDGIIDQYDVDANGNGIIDLLDDVVLQFPDLNGDGRDDVYDAVTPETGALLRTGVGSLGGGCSILPGSRGQVSSPADFLLLYMLLIAIAGLYRKKHS